jgi:hypothetical protein
MPEFNTFPHVVDNFITQEENNILLDISENNDSVFKLSTDTFEESNRWKNKVAYSSIIKLSHPDISDLMHDITGRINNYMCAIQPALEIYTELLQFSRWTAGDNLLPGHIDNCEANGEDNLSPWRNYGFVLYLNDNFEGGELTYNNYAKTIKPRPRMLAVHTASPDCMHSVKTVRNGVRHTMIGFATINTKHYSNNTDAYYQGELEIAQ